VQGFTAERQGDSDTTGSEFFFNNFGPVGKVIYVSLIRYYLEGWRLTLNNGGQNRNCEAKVQLFS
jgi:hypothetical protein